MVAQDAAAKRSARRQRRYTAPVNYCSACGKPVVRKVPPGDDRERFVCGHCGVIHYQNPKVVAGCLPICGDRVLLCQRGIEPRKGYWTLPAGFLEAGETIAAGAERETREEALAQVSIIGLYTVFNVPHISQVHMFFRATLDSGQFGVGAESLDARLVAEGDVPWDELAFPVVSRTLAHYFRDRGAGRFPVRVEDVPPLRQGKPTPG